MISSLLEMYIAAQLSSVDQLKGVESQWDPATVLTAHPIPTHDGIHIAPIVEATSAIVVDLDTGMVLFEKNPYEKLPFASITKLMTAIVVMEENEMDEVVTVSGNSAQTGGSRIWLLSGETIRLKDLLYAILIHSGNDAAIALAEHNAESVDGFVEKMNAKAQMLGLYDTSFSNPIGFDDEKNYSTVHDLALLGRYAFRKDFVRHAVGIQNMEVSSVNGRHKHELKNTNKLLGKDYFNVKGLKTGSTDLAGLCFVSVAENDNGNRVMTIVLNSPDRFRETKILIDWTFRAFKW